MRPNNASGPIENASDPVAEALVGRRELGRHGQPDPAAQAAYVDSVHDIDPASRRPVAV